MMIVGHNIGNVFLWFLSSPPKNLFGFYLHFYLMLYIYFHLKWRHYNDYYIWYFSLLRIIKMVEEFAFVWLYLALPLH